jgi:all-trans-8'-apo-beta-carotenal 15,15'-oxygenase
MNDWLRSFKNIKEVRRPLPLKPIIGHIPKSLQGTWYKASPGEFDSYNSPTNHPYDGDGFISAIRFEQGQATYQARFVNTLHRQKEQRAQKRLYSGAFGTPPHLKEIKNPANTSVFYWNKELVVFSDCGPAYRLDPLTLETKGLFANFKEGFPLQTKLPLLDYLIGGDVLGAHPKIVDHGKTFVYYTLSNSLSDATITFHEAHTDGSLHKKEYSLPYPLYFTHDFTVTPTHYVFVQHNLELDLANYKHGIINCLKSNPQRPFNLVHVLPRANHVTPTASTIATQPFFITHHLALHENNLYATAYSHCFDWNSLPPPGFITKIDLLNQTETLIDKWIEFPVSTLQNTDSLNPTPNKHTYALHLNEKSNTLLQLIPPHQTKQSWTALTRQFLSEPMVDPSDTYVMCLCYDAAVHKSYVYLFESKNIEQGPITIIEMPEVIPVGLHGTYVNSLSH